MRILESLGISRDAIASAARSVSPPMRPPPITKREARRLRNERIKAAKSNGATSEEIAVTEGLSRRGVDRITGTPYPVGPGRLKCPHCGIKGTHFVMNSRGESETNRIYRKRECAGCGKGFSTWEEIE